MEIFDRQILDKGRSHLWSDDKEAIRLAVANAYQYPSPLEFLPMSATFPPMKNTCAMHLPAYAEVIERYDLDILKVPGDLVAKDGNIAITKYGDLMQNNAEYSAMSRLVQGWRFGAPTLQTLFEMAFTTMRLWKDLDESRNHAFTSRRFDAYHELNDEIGANELASAAYAGVVIPMLNRLLLAFKDDMHSTRDDWEKSPPLIEGHSVGSLLEASANNFRHNDEWAKTRPSDETYTRQRQSRNVLAAAHQEPDGSDRRLSRDKPNYRLGSRSAIRRSSANDRSCASRRFAALQHFSGYRRHSGLGRPYNSMLSSRFNNEGRNPTHQTASVARNDFHRYNWSMELVADINRERSLYAVRSAYLTSNSVAENPAKDRTSVVRASLNARYYSSAQGQFLSEDPVFIGDPKQQNLKDPQSLNSYSYAGDNHLGTSVIGATTTIYAYDENDKRARIETPEALHSR